jgi:hypothetical protein
MVGNVLIISVVFLLGMYLVYSTKGVWSMNLILWMTGMFAIGILSMGLCFLFIKACEKI